MSRGAPTAPFQSARWPLVLQWMPRVNPMRLLIMAIGLYTTCYCFVNENRVCFLVMFQDSNIRFSNPASCCLDDRWRSYSWLLKAATPGRRWPTCYRRSRGAYRAQRHGGTAGHDPVVQHLLFFETRPAPCCHSTPLFSSCGGSRLPSSTRRRATLLSEHQQCCHLLL